MLKEGQNNFETPRVIVTGGTEGLGREITRIFSGKVDTRVAICARTPERIADLKNELGETLVTESLDLVDREKAKRFIRSSIDELGGLDLLVLNAAVTGIERKDLGQEENQRRADYAKKVNFDSNVEILNEASDDLSRSCGSLVFFTSRFTQMEIPPKSVTAYAESKKKMEEFLKDFSQQEKNKDIFVVIIEPGRLRTRIPAEARDFASDEVSELVKKEEPNWKNPALAGRVVAEIVRTRCDFDPITRQFTRPINSGEKVSLTEDYFRWAEENKEG